MNEAFTTVGIAHGPHKDYNSMVVVTFTLSFKDGTPGIAPSVGQSKDGKHTVQSADRKTEQSTLTASGDLFEINTDDLQADNLDNLSLSAKGKILTLSKTFKSGGKTKKKNMQWQLPFSFSPESVVARYNNGEVYITLPKPNPAELASNANIILGEYTVNPSGNEKISIDVKKSGNQYILTLTGSTKPEIVTVSFQADMFTFNGVKEGTNGPVTSLPARLPFILARELITIKADPQKIIATISKPGTTKPISIPIRSN